MVFFVLLSFVNMTQDPNVVQSSSWFVMVVWPLAYICVLVFIFTWETWMDKKQIKLKLKTGLKLEKLSVAELERFIREDMDFLLPKRTKQFQKFLMNSIDDDLKRDDLIRQLHLEINNNSFGHSVIILIPLLLCVYYLFQYYFGVF